MSLCTHLAVAVSACLLASCGDDGEPAAERRAPAATATATATAQATATATATPAATPSATATATATPTPAPSPGAGGGDEAGNRVEISIELFVEDVLPRELEVPAFLGLRLKAANKSGSERILRLDGKPVIELLPGDTQSVDLPGLRPGRHVLEAGESGRLTLEAVPATG